MEPVLKRADSAKQFVMLDDALKVADKYVDKYLPDKDPPNEDEKPSKQIFFKIFSVSLSLARP